MACVQGTVSTGAPGACLLPPPQPPLVRTLLMFLVVVSRGQGRALPHAIRCAAPGQGHTSPSHALPVALAGPRLGAHWRHPGLAECVALGSTTLSPPGELV